MSLIIPSNQKAPLISFTGNNNSVMVTDCQSLQHSPVSSYSRGNSKEELFMLEQDAENHNDSRENSRELLIFKQDLEVQASKYHKIKDDQLILHNEEQPSGVLASEEHFTISKRSDELVVNEHHHNWIQPSDDTIVCRYCREEVKNCYYDDHLVRCSCNIGYGYRKNKQLLTCYNNQENNNGTISEEETKENVIIAVQASDQSSDIKFYYNIIHQYIYF